MEKHLETLKLIADKLNKNDIRWGLGASMLLYLKGITNKVNDLDFIIENDRFEECLVLFNDYEYKIKEKSDGYLTEHFIESVINGIDVDFMFNFRIKTEVGLYEYPFENDLEEMMIDDTKIYLLSIEDWLEAYKVMGRENKIELLENYLKEKSNE